MVVVVLGVEDRLGQRLKGGLDAVLPHEPGHLDVVVAVVAHNARRGPLDCSEERDRDGEQAQGAQGKQQALTGGRSQAADRSPLVAGNVFVVGPANRLALLYLGGHDPALNFPRRRPR